MTLWSVHTGPVPKVMPPIWWWWLAASEVDVSDMTVEAEPSCQYSITFGFYVADGNGGAV